MVSIDEFRKDFINEIAITSIDSSQHETDAFIDEMIDTLVNDFSIINYLDKCYYSFNNGNKQYKNMQIDAGNLDLISNRVDLLIADYNSGDMTTINIEFIKNKSKLMLNYFENAIKGFFENAEKSDVAVQLAYNILRNIDSIYKIHLIIISTNILSERVKTIELDDYKFNNRTFKVDLDVIDMQKIYNSRLPSFQKEPVEIATSDFGVSGIQCIKADIGSEDYESYLAIVPGKFLCDIYKKYGPRLLESNVRSFLNVKGTVNKGIHNTIQNERDKFFTYNNGISTIAKSIDVEQRDTGLYINHFNDFQIINGGQTTASLASADIKDHMPLDRIFVQMKLTILKEENADMIHCISQYANSQNKVTAADLNSNHPYYVKMEEFSRKIFAPPINNATYQTLWFFERARGQYEQPKMSMTKSEREKYTMINPKNQKFGKTELAKYINSSEMQPYDVSRGAEQNLIKFQENLERKWKDKNQFNESYYRDLIGKAILFKAIEGIISNQQWYMENKAYRAQLVTYTFSKLVYEVSKLNLELNYKLIWDKQCIPNYLVSDIERISKLAYDTLNDPNRSFSNIGEYAKRKDCWDILKSKECLLKEETIDGCLTKEEKKIENISAKKEQKLNDSIAESINIFNIGADKWQTIIDEGIKHNILSENDKDILNHARKYSMGIDSNMTPAQTAKILEIKNKIIDECGLII